VSGTLSLDERGRALGRVLGELLGGPVAMELLKEKPGRRRTLRAIGARGSAIVKTYASERAPTVGARVKALRAGPAEPLVPEVLMVDWRLRTVVLTDVPGRPLRAALMRGEAADCRRAGAALGAWHSAWHSRDPAPLRQHTAERELELLDRRANRAPAPLRHAVRRAARGLTGGWPLATVVHRDLYEEQILLGDLVGLIDLDDVAIGPPELDVGNLLAHIALLSLRSGRPLGSPRDELLAGYSGSGAELDQRLLERCRRLALLRLACIHQEPAILP
jgi:hypothetical protein